MLMHRTSGNTLPHLAFFVSALLLAGCGMSGNAPTATPIPVPTPQTHGLINGSVHGGQQVVSGSAIYLFAASTTGYSGAATSLLSGSNVTLDGNGNGYVTTNANGDFAISGDYNCPTASSLVYLLAVGGNPGLTPGTSNTALTLAAALGNCNTLKANAATTFISMNELTTVALAYSLAGFMSSPTAAGATSTNLTGITNAFATASVLVNTAYGSAPTNTTAGNGVVPQAELNTLADIIAACVNSNGATTNPSACYSLFSATAVNNVTPANTLQALLNIAHNPASNVSALASLVSAQPPFQPTLSGPPNDWTMAITYTGSGINTPQAIAIDAAGNAWIPNTSNTITELAAATGSPLSGGNGFTPAGLDAPVSIALDTTGNVWIANCGNVCSGSGNPSSVTELNAAGTTASTYTSTGFNGAYAIALSGANQAWVANSLGSSLTQLNASGNTIIASDIAANLIYPISVAVTPAGNALTVSPANNAIVGFTSSGSADIADSYQGTNLNYPYAVAIDHTGNTWVANHGNNSVSKLNSGTPAGSSPFTGGGITTPVAIALDGAGNAWVANTSDTISEISNAGTVLSPATGLRNDLIYPNGIAVDPSGNIWVTSCGSYCQSSSASTGSVSLIVGAATPVVTPLAAGAASNKLATEP